MPANQVSVSTGNHVVMAAMDSADNKEKPWSHGEMNSPCLCCGSEREPPQLIWETQQGDEWQRDDSTVSPTEWETDECI